MTRSAWLGAAWLAGLLVSPVPGTAEIFVTSGDGVRVFADNAGGDSTELRAIYRDGDFQNGICCLALDLAHRELYTVDITDVTVFDMDASGPVTPLRVLYGPNTGLVNPDGIAVDALHDEIFVADGDAKGVFVFSRTADGDTAPLRSIAGTDAFGANGRPGLVFLDLVHDELFVSVTSIGGGSVAVFNRTDSGNASPKRAITGLNNPRSVVVDLERDELFVTEYDHSLIKVFDRGASGPAIVKRTIVLPPGTTKPYELVITDGDEMIVGLDGTLGRRLIGFQVTAAGNAAPTRSLEPGFVVATVGVVSTRAGECSSDRTVDGCLLQDGFESGSICTLGWSAVVGSTTACPVCGDGQIDGSETCDDDGTIDGDGCSALCAVEWGYQCAGEPSACAPTCGDGRIAFGVEQCDDHDAVSDDGCSSTCTIEPGYTCELEPSDCSLEK